MQVLVTLELSQHSSLAISGLDGAAAQVALSFAWPVSGTTIDTQASTTPRGGP